MYGVSFRWDTGAELEFDGFWNSDVTGAANRDLGQVDVNNKLWTFNDNVVVGGELEATTLDINGNADISGTLDVHGAHIRAHGGNIYVEDSNSDNIHVYIQSNSTEGYLRVGNGANWGLLARGVTNSPRLGAYHNGTLDIYGFGSADAADHADDDLLAQFNFAGEKFIVNGEIEGASLDINGNADISGNLTGVDNLTINGTLTGVSTATFAGDVQILTSSGEYSIYAAADGQTALYTNGVKKFETMSTGATVISTTATFLIEGSGVTSADLKFRTNEVDRWKIGVPSGQTNLALITGSTTVLSLDTSNNATFAGEVEAASLDVNGVADISGVLTTHSTVKIGATQKLYLDGGSNSYIHESAGDTIDIVTGGTTRLTANSNGISSSHNVYSGNSSHFRNYGGTWKGTTGLTGNGFEFINSVDGTALTLSSTGNAVFTGTVTANGTTLTGDQTAAEILTAIKTVDGAGTGLDADTVDGYQAANLLARANHTGTQAASTISDFDTEVANNSAVTANTAKTSNIVQTTVSGSSGSCTGNAATATALTTGNKTIQGSLSITGDGSNATVMAESGSGDFEINTVADIVLDAGGGDITLRENGTTFGELERGGDHFNIVAKIQNGDIRFYGNDGGSSVTALTLDMSDAGKATFNNDVVAFSDRKLKENIETLDGKKVLDMRGVSFTRKDTGLPSSGVIAQEIQKVAPELVSETDGTLGVSYGNLVGYLIEAVKDQQKQIDELKAIINGSSK